MKLATPGEKTYIALLFALASLCSPSSALELCELSIEIDTEYSFSDSRKLSILGYEPSISYVSVVEGVLPSLKILGASETPTVFTDESGVLTISTSTCTGSVLVEDSNEPTSAPTIDDSAAYSALTFGTFFMNMILAHRFAPMRGIFLAATMLGSLAPAVMADGEICEPTIQIEISTPMASQVTEKFGETDHYLAANLDTVTWGFYDPNATAVISMESGQTITVEVLTHHGGHDFAKMIRGDTAMEDVYYWEAGQSLTDKPEPKPAGSGVHLVTGPIEVIGAEPGDVVEVEILELDPRLNPETGRCFGTNSQKFAGYHFRADSGLARDGTQYVRTGGTEAITVIEFLEDDEGNMLYGKPVYMYRFPNMTAPDGSTRTFDNNPAVTVPHEFDHGYDGELMDSMPIMYPEGFDDTVVTDEGGIVYLSPEESGLNWKIPLRPHLGTLAVMPNNAANYIDEDAPAGANTIPPARFGGNIDDWRIGKGGTMFYNVEVPGALILVGDTHAAQGDSELAGTAMETSMTTKLRVTLHKQGSLPKKVANMPFPLLETSTNFIVHGFAFDNYLDQLADPSTIFAEGASLDLAFEDVFLKTRDWMMDTFDITEEETIAIMTTSVDFGITQVVDGNWGTHADLPKWVFEEGDTPFDYSCTTSRGPGRRHLDERRVLRTSERRQLMADLGVDEEPEDYAKTLYNKITKKCESCGDSMDRHALAHKLLDTKLHFAKAKKASSEKFPPFN